MALPSAQADPDLYRDVPELISSRGFVCERHEVTTTDGYVLTLHRIVNPVLKSLESSPKKNKTISVVRSHLLDKPVILQHGLLSSSSDFIINSTGGDLLDTTMACDNPDHDFVEVGLKPDTNAKVGNNLGFELARRGMDVWMPNIRGNSYSRKHTTMSADALMDKSYWDFSFDEMIKYDMPAIISYILKKTNSSTVSYVGHSQGCQIMFGLLSTQAKYNALVKPFIALSPVTTVGNVKSPLKALADQTFMLKVFKMIGGPFLPSSSLMRSLAARSNLLPSGLWCKNFTFLFGYNKLDMARLPVYLTHTPSGTSTKNMLHFSQSVVSKKFRMYDMGSAAGNQARYGSPEPPEYPLEKITCKSMAIFSSLNDWFCDVKDLDGLRTRLTVPLLEDYVVPDKEFNHLDFLWGTDVGQLVNRKVLELLDKCHRDE